MKQRNNKYRSNFEATFADLLESIDTSYTYEPDSFDYVVTHSYTPDFRITSNIYVETKGLLDASDRSKMIRVKKQHPKLVIVLCFMNPNLKLNKTSKTTYRTWADKHGFLWCEANAFSLRTALTKAHRLRMELEGED